VHEPTVVEEYDKVENNVKIPHCFTLHDPLLLTA